MYLVASWYVLTVGVVEAYVLGRSHMYTVNAMPEHVSKHQPHNVVKQNRPQTCIIVMLCGFNANHNGCTHARKTGHVSRVWGCI